MQDFNLHTFLLGQDEGGPVEPRPHRVPGQAGRGRGGRTSR